MRLGLRIREVAFLIWAVYSNVKRLSTVRQGSAATPLVYAKTWADKIICLSVRAGRGLCGSLSKKYTVLKKAD